MRGAGVPAQSVAACATFHETSAPNGGLVWQQCRAATTAQESRASVAELRSQLVAQQQLSQDLLRNSEAQSTALRDLIEQQGSLVGELEADVRRTLGHVVVPVALENLKAAVAEDLQDWLPPEQPQSLPKDGDPIREELAALELSMQQSGLRGAFSTKLNQLYWWADVLDALATADGGGEQSATAYGDFQALRLASPSGMPDWAFRLVRKAEQQSLLATVQEQVNGIPNVVSLDEADALGDLLDAVKREFGGDAPTSLQAAEVTLKAKRAALAAEGLAIGVRELEAERSAALGVISDPRIKVVVMAGFDGQLTAVFAQMAIATPDTRSMAEKLLRQWGIETQALGASIHSADHLRYQRWALEQITGMDEAFDAATGAADDEVAIQNAMITHLMPIDQGLLDPALAVKFQKTWNDAKEELGDPEVKAVIRATGTVVKKGLGEV